MIELEQTTGHYALTAGELRLAFRYRIDRWAHVLSLRTPAGWKPVLSSVEGEPEAAVPDSPPFQDLRLERIADETYEFQLFGQAGQGVYSSAVRMDGQAQEISFDVAARSQRARAEICERSNYDVAEDVALSADDAPTCMGFRFDGASELLLTGSKVIVSRAHGEMTGAGRRLRVAIATIEIPQSRTARWQYRVRLAPVP